MDILASLKSNLSFNVSFTFQVQVFLVQMWKQRQSETVKRWKVKDNQRHGHECRSWVSEGIFEGWISDFQRWSLGGQFVDEGSCHSRQTCPKTYFSLSLNIHLLKQVNPGTNLCPANNVYFLSREQRCWGFPADVNPVEVFWSHYPVYFKALHRGSNVQPWWFLSLC